MVADGEEPRPKGGSTPSVSSIHITVTDHHGGQATRSSSKTKRGIIDSSGPGTSSACVGAAYPGSLSGSGPSAAAKRLEKVRRTNPKFSQQGIPDHSGFGPGQPADRHGRTPVAQIAPLKLRTDLKPDRNMDRERSPRAMSPRGQRAALAAQLQTAADQLYPGVSSSSDGVPSQVASPAPRHQAQNSTQELLHGFHTPNKAHVLGPTSAYPSGQRSPDIRDTPPQDQPSAGLVTPGHATANHSYVTHNTAYVMQAADPIDRVALEQRERDVALRAELQATRSVEEIASSLHAKALAEQRLEIASETEESRRKDAAAFASGTQQYEAAVRHAELTAQSRVEILFINEREEMQRMRTAMARQNEITRELEINAAAQSQALSSETAAAAEAVRRASETARSSRPTGSDPTVAASAVAQPFGSAPANIVNLPPLYHHKYFLFQRLIRACFIPLRHTKQWPQGRCLVQRMGKTLAGRSHPVNRCWMAEPECCKTSLSCEQKHKLMQHGTATS